MRTTETGPSDERETVKPGERSKVHIGNLGDKGDGIAKVGPGYIIFAPATEVDDRVKIEIDEVREISTFGAAIDA